MKGGESTWVSERKEQFIFGIQHCLSKETKGFSSKLKIGLMKGVESTWVSERKEQIV